MDPTLPPSLAAELADLKRRLANLERSPSIPFSSARGGVFTYLDETGKPRFELGNVNLVAGLQVPADQPYGVFARGDDAGIALMLREGNRGLVSPLLPVPFVNRDGGVTVTSATFVETHQSWVLFPAHEVIKVQVTVDCPAATTAEVRLINFATDETTNAFTVPANTSQVVTFDWLFSDVSVGLYDQHAHTAVDMTCVLQARRASGAGNVIVHTPLGTMTSKFLEPDASATGNPH